MVGVEHLPAEFVEDVRRYKYRGSSGKVNLALDGLPDFTALPGAGPHLRGAVSISPGVEYMERAYDEAKYGRYSRRPYIDMVIPSLTDPSVAPPGKHVASCFVQYAPYHLKEGNWDDEREAFGDTVINTLAEYAPNIKDLILHRQVLTPLDIERDFGLTEGNIFQGELTLEQLFFLRPAPGWAQVPHAGEEPLHVRLGDASWWRNHGSAGTERCEQDSEGDRTVTAPVAAAAAQRRRWPAASLFREAGKRSRLIRALRSVPRRVRDACGRHMPSAQMRRWWVGTYADHTGRTRRVNRLARFPAARCGASLQGTRPSSAGAALDSAA